MNIDIDDLFNGLSDEEKSIIVKSGVAAMQQQRRALDDGLMDAWDEASAQVQAERDAELLMAAREAERRAATMAHGEQILYPGADLNSVEQVTGRLNWLLSLPNRSPTEEKERVQLTRWLEGNFKKFSRSGKSWR